MIESLTDVTFEKDTSLNEIQDSAFNRTNKLSKIIVPAGVTTIGKEAFYLPYNQDSSLNKIIFPEQVTNYEDVFNNPGLYPSNNPIIYVKGKDDGRLYYGSLDVSGSGASNQVVLMYLLYKYHIVSS